MAKAKSVDFLHSRVGYIAETVLAILAMYLIASRAIDTGSLQQYFLTFLFLAIAINRLIKSFKG